MAIAKTPPHKRRCIDCVHFQPNTFMTRERDNLGRKRKAYLYGCGKRPSGYICYWVSSMSDLNVYDDMLGCFESTGQLQLQFEEG